MDRIPNRANWMLTDYKELMIDDKPRLIQKYFNEELIEILSMFKYDNLPKTINERTLELFILGGYANIFMKDGKIYNGIGKMGGRLDYRYIPDTATLTNTYLNYSSTLEVVTPLNVDEINESNREKYVCVINNDYLYYGIMDALREYAEYQTECDLSLKFLLYNLRIPNIAVTNDNNVKTAFKDVYKSIIDGKPSDAVMGNMLYDALKTYPIDASVQGRIKEVIELKQYKKAQFENRFGLGTNYNMKRESLTDNEVNADSDTLLPTPDEMLKCRQAGLELVNKAFGCNISVDFASAWKNRREDMKLEKEIIEETIDEGGEDDEMSKDDNQGNDNDTRN